MKRYAALAANSKSGDKTEALGKTILSDYSRDWRIPYRLAKAILTDPTARSRDLDLALRATT